MYANLIGEALLSMTLHQTHAESALKQPRSLADLLHVAATPTSSQEMQTNWVKEGSSKQLHTEYIHT